MPLGSKLNLPRGHILHLIIYGNDQTTSFLEPLMGIWPNSTGMVTAWSPTKIVQMVLIGCICRSRGKKIGFQNAMLKNLLIKNYKTQSFYIWYKTLSKDPLPKLFKLCPWGHNFTLDYIRKTSNDFLSWIANGNLTKLNRNDPCVVLYQNCSNGSDWLHK